MGTAVAMTPVRAPHPCVSSPGASAAPANPSVHVPPREAKIPSDPREAAASLRNSGAADYIFEA
jgi:hypothetical protein